MSRAVWVPGRGEVPPAAEIGGKAHHLARVSEAGRVPPWVVLRTDLPARLLETAGARPAGVDAMRAALLSLEPGAALRGELEGALEEAGVRGGLLAVRSSAVGEDAAGASFAGQYATLLGVREEGLWDAVRAVWASALEAHALAYAGGAAGEERAAHPPRMGVIVQAQLDAVAAGVAFGVDPVRQDAETVVVSAVPGLGEGLVSGELDADSYRVRGEAIEAEIAEKPWQFALAGGGRTERREVPEGERALPVLSDGEVRAVAAATRRLGEIFGAPQDVEWALAGEGRELHLLQSRPVTAWTTPGERRLWDNSNIVESYGGVTTALTFSFARAVYEDVYRQFVRLLGVEEPLIEENQRVFAHMLGLHEGRVYYNLLNWYRTLALLPGFGVNRSFMERMMGVRESLGREEVRPPAIGRGRDALRLARMLARMRREHARLRREVPAFHARVEAALAPLRGEDLTRRSPDELLALYRRLEGELLRHWKPPLVNDFFAMIWFGVLGRLVERWMPEAPPTLVNDLLCGEGGIVSTEPARRVMALAQMVAESGELRALFAAEPDDAALWARLHADPAAAPFAAEVAAYLERFGDRCVNELKLETVTLGEDPAFLLQMVRSYAAAGAPDPEAARAREREVRGAAERQVEERLGGARLRIFRGVLRRTRERVRDRENLRFERTRVFGAVRRIFLALGGHLAREGRIATPRDVFHLTVEEIFAVHEGTSITRDLRALTQLRRAEFEAAQGADPPPDRFETRGPPRAPSRAAEEVVTGVSLTGTGCCPGVVRGRVRVVRDPRQAGELGGCILVAERTDPGWTLLFPVVSGLLVERGSLLSHSAIVAREMGIPCVVSIPRLLDTLRDGEEVEMDGATGVVRLLEREEGG